jgi:PAS domain S-box-containing protein
MNTTTIDFSSLFIHSPIPHWVYDLETHNILEVNNATITQYGYTRKEFLQLNMKDLGLEEELKNFLRANQQEEAESGNINFGVFTHKKKNGEQIKVEIHGHRIGCQEKNAMMVTVVDVTRQMKTLEDVRESEEKLKEASKIARLGYWKLDLIHNTLTWSDEVYSIWGVSQEHFIPSFETFFSTIHPEDQDTFERVQHDVLNGNGVLNHPHRIILPDGSIKWVLERGRLNIVDGQAVALFGTVQDITEQKLEEQRLLMMESTVTHSNDAVIITEAEPFDAHGPKILYVNKAFTDMTGYTPEEMIGKTPALLQGPKTNLKELEKLMQASKKREPCDISLINYKKTGEPFWVDISVFPVADDKGWVSHWMAIKRNITPQKIEQIQNVLFTEISKVFNEEHNLKNALYRSCALISKLSDFSLSEIWLPNTDNEKLQLFVHCSCDNHVEQFYDQSGINEFQINEGLPGKVWNTKECIVISHADQNPEFLRIKVAKESGIKTVIGIPLTHQEKILGVMVMGTRDNDKEIETLKPILKKLETFIGSEINRKKLETELQQLFDALPDMICLVDLNGHFIKINRAGCDILGYSEEELIGESYLRFVHPADKVITNQEQKNVVHGQASTTFENRYITRSGDIVWLSWHSNIIVEEGIIYATAKNITREKKLAELVRNANRLAKIGSWEIDFVKNKVYWSDMVHFLHETNPATYIPELESGIDFYKPEYREHVKSRIENALTTGEPFDFEAPLITAKGNEKWVRSIGSAEFSEGHCIRLYGSFQDIHQLKTAEIQISEILGSISDAFYAVDKNWNFTYFNKEAENLLLRKSEELIGKNLWEEFAPAVGTEIEKIYREVSKTGKPQTFEYFYPGNGSWFEVNTYPSNGGVSSYFKNIDERRKNAEAIRKALEEKNNILESIGDAFFAVDNNWIVTYWNKEAEKILFKPKHEIIGRNLWEEYSDAIDSLFYSMYHLAKTTGEAVTFEEYYKTSNLWLEVSAYPTDEGLSVYFKDITSRKEIEDKIQIANERFEKVALATSDAIWDWDIESNSFYRGDGYHELFGNDICNHMLEFETWLDDSSNVPVDQLRQMFMDNLNNPSKDNWILEYSIKAPDGDVRSVIDKGIIIRDTYGKAIRLVGAITDITYRKNFERQLLQLNKELQKQVKALKIANEELEQFAFITSHDLQEPLRMITSFMDQLQRKYSEHLDDKANQYIYFATDGAKRMKKIILDLLEYSRAGKSNHHLERVNLTEILDNFCYLRKKIIEEKGVILNYENLPEVLASKTPLTQVLHNLLDNAIKYTRSEVTPIIELTVTNQEGEWLFEIKDNGIGIEKEFYDKIFVIFQRLHNRDHFDGTGIGLALVKKQVESWGGKIGVQSNVNQGSRFYFTLKNKL